MSVNKSNHPIQNPLLLIREPLIHDNMIKYCDGAKRIDLGILTNLYDFSLGTCEEVGFGMSSACLSFPSLGPEIFVGFCSHSVFMGLCNLGRCQ
jgi:hypothetical protein